MARTGRVPLQRTGLVVAAGAAAVVVAAANPAPAATQDYSFVKVADSTEDGLAANSFGCASINRSGAVAFRAGRVADDGFNVVDGIYRADVGAGALTTIAEDRDRFDFLARNPSMNDRGQVSFAAALERGGEGIFRGRGGRLTPIARTSAPRFNFFGFDTSVDNSGRVAFKAEMDRRFDFDEGLFSGEGSAVATHYRASTSRFSGNDSRPSINNLGDIAFDERVGDGEPGVFVTRGAGFETIYAPDPDIDDFVSEPVLNDAGTAIFERSFFDEDNQVFVTELVTGNGGPLTTVVDNSGAFGSFGFRPPALNSSGDVAFSATRTDDAATAGVFVGPRPRADRVITVGQQLDGATVQNVAFCEEGLSDSGELAFVAQLEDPGAPDGFRVAVFRATPRA